MSNEIEGISPEEMAMVEADRTGTEAPEAPVEAAEIKEVPPEVAQPEEVKTETVKPPDGFVPHGALHEERARRKEIQKQFQELNEKYTRADERLKILSGTETKAQALSFDEDPLGYSKAELDRLNQVSSQYPNQLDELKGEIQTMRMQRTVEKMESQFEQSHPDYRQALSFYAKSRAEAITELGYETEEAVGIVRGEMVNAINKAFESGRNPAEVIYKMAGKSGYSSHSKDTKNLDTLKKAENASKSLSDSSGQAKGELSAEALAEMSDEDFNKVSDEQFRKAMGG